MFYIYVLSPSETGMIVVSAFTVSRIVVWNFKLPKQLVLIRELLNICNMVSGRSAGYDPLSQHDEIRRYKSCGSFNQSLLSMIRRE